MFKVNLVLRDVCCQLLRTPGVPGVPVEYWRIIWPHVTIDMFMREHRKFSQKLIHKTFPAIRYSNKVELGKTKPKNSKFSKMDHYRFKEVIKWGGFELINISHFRAETRIGFKNSNKENIKYKRSFSYLFGGFKKIIC